MNYFFADSGWLPVFAIILFLSVLISSMQSKTLVHIIISMFPLFVQHQSYYHSLTNFPLAPIEDHQLYSLYWSLAVLTLTYGAHWLGATAKIFK